MELYEKVIKRERCYEGKIFALDHLQVELPDGRPATRDVIENADAVCVVAIDEEDQLLLVKQYRIAAGRVLTEIPAGKLNPSESPLEGALRELREETGCVPGKMEYLFGLQMTPGFVTETVHHFLASELRFEQARPDDGEFLQVERVAFSRVVEDIMAGRIHDGKTVAGVLAAARRRDCPSGERR
jgi:ADP-ribose pyrophosphatase